MQKSVVLFLSAATLMAMSSCSSKLGELSADNFSVVPNPLETESGKVPTTINGKFPEKYMQKKAVVTVTPELRYGNGKTQTGRSETFQGEKVAGNNITVNYKMGGNYTMKTNFDYTPEMHKSDLYLTFDAYVGKKKVNVPAVKIAEGIISTSELYKKTLFSDGICLAPDTFQRVQQQKQEAQIKFLINQANLRKSEMKNSSVKDFVSMLKKINQDKEGLNIKNVEISAYASPDGGVAFNDKLASKRQNVSESYVNKTLKETKVKTDVAASYTAQDWDGFQKLVAASNLQDKDVVLRVLSMYQDPQEREQQIRNMSAGYRELADGILPELRRSRLIINYETIGRSDEQIKEQYANDASKLSVDELLYAATLENNADKKEEIYKTAAKEYPNDARAFNNIAVLEAAKGNTAEAQTYLNLALSKGGQTAEANANKGLIALQQGNTEEARNLIAKATGANDLSKALGALNIAQGNYDQAEKNFEGINTNTSALAQILNKNYRGAKETLSKVANKNAMTDYLYAIVNARQGNKTEAASYLKSALAKDSSLKAYADNDLELKNIK